MSKKSNPTLIGAFVVGAVLLIAAGVALFGGSELLAERENFSTYFTENTKGLREGSNVMLNGVRVGYVSGMALIVDQDSFESKTEVTLEILPDSFIVTRSGERIGEGMESAVPHDQLIHKGGLRASLQAESFVTGQLLVELDFRPDTEVILRGDKNTRYREIPTIPSNIQELLAKVQRWIADINEGFDAKELGERLQSVMKGLDELMNSEDVRESLAGINTLINRPETQELTANLEATLAELRSAVNDAGKLLRNADTRLDTLQTDLEPVIASIRGLLDEAQQTLAAATSQLEGDSAETYQFGETLREVENAARALREFMDYLERNPEAILRGKKQ